MFNGLIKLLTSLNDRFNGMAKGSAHLLIYRLGAMLLSYLFTWFIAKNFGAALLGKYALMNATIMVGVLITRLGLDQLFLREVSSVDAKVVSKYENTYRNILGLQLTIGAIISLLVYFLAEFLSIYWLDSPEMIPIIRMSALIVIPLTFNFLHAEGFRGKKRLFNYISLVRIWPLVFTILGIIFFNATIQDNEEVFFWIYFTSVIVTMVIGLWLWALGDRTIRLPAFEIRKWVDLLKQSYPMILAGSMFLIMGWTDTFMLGFFETKASVGYYHVAIKVSNVVSLVLFGINGIAAPRISYSWANGLKKEFDSVIGSSASLSFLFSLPLVLTIIIFRVELLNLFGEGMEVAAIALILLALGQFVNGSCGSVMNILQMTHNQKYAQYVLMSAALLNVILNYTLIPKYGISGAAFSTGCSTAFWNLASVGVVRWRLQVWSVPFLGGFKSVLKLIRDKRS